LSYGPYLPSPLAGVWNEEALKASTEVVLCEALIDAMTFWCAGFRNVIAAYGCNGFSADHLAALQYHGVPSPTQEIFRHRNGCIRTQ